MLNEVRLFCFTCTVLQRNFMQGMAAGGQCVFSVNIITTKLQNSIFLNVEIKTNSVKSNAIINSKHKFQDNYSGPNCT